MAQVFTWPQSPLFNNSALGTEIHCALGAWFKVDPQSKSNWFNNKILVPLDIGKFMMLMGASRLSAAEISSLNKITYRSSWWVNDYGGGANLLNMLQIQLWRGLATANTTAIKQALDRAWADVIIQPRLSGQGIMPDESYHFHSSQLMTGSYGAAWLDGVLGFAVQTRGTSFEMNDTRKETLANSIAGGYAWMDIGSQWDFGVIGRYVARPVASQHSTPEKNDSLSQFAPMWPRKTAAINAYVNRRLALPGAEPLVGNRHFYTSDFMVHRHNTWISTLRLQSKRNVATECDNGENLKGEHLSNGVLNVYAKDAQVGNGDEYNYIYPLWDWKTINGVTAESDATLLTCWTPKSGGVQFPLKKLAFVGGVSDGTYGAATMV
jgi:chondroitin AC lyase